MKSKVTDFENGRRIKKMIHPDDPPCLDNNIYIHLRTHATLSSIDVFHLYGHIIIEKEKAICFRPLHAKEKEKIWIPKKALVYKYEEVNKKIISGCFEFAHWFIPDKWQDHIIEKYTRF